MLAARTGWSIALVSVITGPVLLRIQPGTGGWAQLDELTGLLATSGLVVAAVLPSRLRSLTRAFGVDGVHLLHRSIGLAAVGLVLAHVACVVAADPTAVALLNPATAPPAAQAAVAATLALSALLALTVTRQRQQYETWRWAHLGLTFVALGGAALHIWLRGRLVHDPVMGPVFAGLVAAVVVVGWWRWAMLPRDPRTEFLVAAVRERSPTVSSVFLEPARSRHRGEPGLPAMPGQFAWLRLSRDPAAQEHPFSIASSVDARRVEFVIRHRGDFTRALRSLALGRRVWLDGPHGAFTPGPEVSRVALVSSGVGIAPMLAILRTAADRGDRRPHLLIQYAAHPDDVLFRCELKELTERLDLDYIEVIAPDPIDPALEQVPRLHRWDWWVCGPPLAVMATTAALAERGVPAGRVNSELFG